eukprot:Amastigsp_a514509_9.p3 type:complete len:194 gc:universal Amastigsp_a514509_9:1488-907(-)
MVGSAACTTTGRSGLFSRRTSKICGGATLFSESRMYGASTGRFLRPPSCGTPRGICASSSTRWCRAAAAASGFVQTRWRLRRVPNAGRASISTAQCRSICSLGRTRDQPRRPKAAVAPTRICAPRPRRACSRTQTRCPGRRGCTRCRTAWRRWGGRSETRSRRAISCFGRGLSSRPSSSGSAQLRMLRRRSRV